MMGYISQDMEKDCVLALCPRNVKLYAATKTSRRQIPLAIIPFEGINRFKRMRNSETGVQVITLLFSLVSRICASPCMLLHVRYIGATKLTA